VADAAVIGKPPHHRPRITNAFLLTGPSEEEKRFEPQTIDLDPDAPDPSNP
jgi:hypothetical protein